MTPFVLKLLSALLPLGLPVDLLAKPRAEGAVARLVQAGAVLHRLGPGLDVEEPRWVRRRIRRLPPGLARFLPSGSCLRGLGAGALLSPMGTAAFHEPDLPHVALAYDFQELTYPEFFDARELRRRRAFREDLGRVDRIVAISEATKRTAIERLRLPAERITVLPPVLPDIRPPLPPPDVGSRLARYGLFPGDFALYPANYWPHKNHERLLRAVPPVRTACPDFRLVLCGALEEARRRLAAEVEALGLTESVRVLGYLPQDDLTALLHAARLLVFPSLHEGFGIPVLEALHLGTPVACSDLPALREVAGPAALFFDPRDEDAIGATLKTLWEDEETRRHLTVAGAVRVDAYSRIDTAREYARLLTSEGL